jgi:hypothetical protein
MLEKVGSGVYIGHCGIAHFVSPAAVTVLWTPRRQQGPGNRANCGAAVQPETQLSKLLGWIGLGVVDIAGVGIKHDIYGVYEV